MYPPFPAPPTSWSPSPACGAAFCHTLKYGDLTASGIAGGLAGLKLELAVTPVKIAPRAQRTYDNLMGDQSRRKEL